MKVVLLTAVVLLVPGLLFAATSQTAYLPDGSEYFTDRFLVTTSVGTPSLSLERSVSGFALTGVNAIDNLCATQQVVSVEPFYPGPVRTPGLRDLIPRMYIFHVAPGADVMTAKAAFAANSQIEAADLYIIAQPVYIPNDPQRNLQWHLTRTQAYEAWDLLRGDTTRYAIVSIVDTGVYWMHPDLAPNMWINSGEDIDSDGNFDSNDINGLDDDGNGYVDDVIGWDFGVNDNDPQEETPTHGTHVAGCASEATDNNRNGAGLGFSARLMAVKGADVSGQLVGVYQGMVYASENGAHIINCSWGSPSFSQSYQNIINGIWNNGVVIVAAAGNFNNTQRFYPAAYSNVLSVAATNSSDHKASFSTYGSWIDVSAPGDGIYSTWATNSFSALSGTSMASPVTCGVAALLRAAHPDWTNGEIVSTIISTADNIDNLNPGYEGQLGSGRVNAFTALGAASFPNVRLAGQQVTITNDDGDGRLNPGESFQLVLSLRNAWAGARNVNVTVAGSDFVISDSTASFGDIPHGDSADNSADPFVLTARQEAIPGPKTMQVHITADSSYVKDTSLVIDVSLDQPGFPRDISGNIESSPVMVDFDNDGSLELVLGASDRNVYAIEANGNNCAGWPKLANNEILSGPAVGDLDHDGVKEVVAVSRDGRIYAWHADGTLLANFPVTKGGTIYSGPALLDVDGDLNLEIAVGSFSDNRVYLIDHDGSDHQGWPITGANKWNGSPSVGDLDGDQLPELIYAGFDSSLHAWNGDGSEVAGFPVRLNGQAWASAAVGDVDEDSHLEIAVLTLTGNCYLVNHDGTVADGFPVNIGRTLKSAPVLADLDGNGNLELIFGDNVGNLCALSLSGSAVPGFPKALGGSLLASPVVGDITGDALPDIVIGSSNNMIHGVDRNGNTLRNFPIPGEALGQITASPALGDLDGDGRMEIAVPIKGLGHNLMVLDYREPALAVNLQWPNFGRDAYRSNNLNLIPVSVSEAPTHPTVFALSQNYPNPFNASTTIEFSLQHAGEATLSIFDLLGRQVRTLHSGMLPAGEHYITWNGIDDAGSGVSSGVYFYRLESADGTQTRRMILLK